MNHFKLDKQFIAKILFIAVVILIIFNWSQVAGALGVVWQVAYPVVLGGMMAYVLNLLMNQFEKRLYPNTDKKWLQHTRRPLAIVLSILVIALVVAGIIGLVVPQLVTAVTTLIEAVPTVTDSLQTWVEEQQHLIPMFNDLMEQVDFNWSSVMSSFAEIGNRLLRGVAESSVSFLSSSASAVTTFVLSVMFALYILMSKERLGKNFNDILISYLSDEQVRIIKNILNVTDDVFSNYITGTVIEAFVLGFIVAIGLWVIKMPYAAMLGALQGALAFIPLVGAFLAGFVGVIIQFAISPINAFIYLIFVIVVQQLEGDFIYPRVVGDSIGLPGMWVLAAVTVGGGLFGISGILLGVPVFATIYKLFSLDISYRKQIREEAKERSLMNEYEEEGLRLKPFEALRHKILTPEDIQDI
ncbi:AI-2E family transporter [Aerococcaceae bacterium INB8]|uniref:AI-2E family transporter n=1 Tax=Ruoffia halotolerans TaxID=2748684 RepID=A0A839A2B1_9LACT|nr:AI-2E family transporter [Ruoffia halotolerans]MBA5728326.1 AI-2E family transporter [Ruoffia halotolerans]